jgi:carboxyl-terminal processing protease
MQKKKLQVWLPLLLSLMMVAGMFVGYQIKQNMPDRGIFFMEKKRPVQEVIDLIDSKYVDNVNTDTLTENAINSLLAKLDPHSLYIPPVELQQVKEELEGSFYGIGIEYALMEDTINVINVVKDGPSEQAGLQIGDRIIKVNDSTVAGVKITSERIRKQLRGAGGSKVNLTLLRNGQPVKAQVTRQGIPLYSLDAAYIIAPSIGYIRLNKFAETTYKEFMRALEDLQKQGMKKLILDLRDNGGGILTEATEIADEFLEDDKLITYTEGAHSARKEYRCKRQGVFEKGELVVLTNENTASASEVLTGALQDWDRATVLGRRTFGKGLVQEQYELADGSGLRLTVARYYTPLGRSIQKSYAGGSLAYSEEVRNRYKEGELQSADSIKHGTGKIYKTPSGKTVYGEGGITPDVFVAFDTTSLNHKLVGLYIKNTLSNFAYLNYLQHKTELASYNSINKYISGYEVDEPTWTSFEKFAMKDSVNVSDITPLEKKELKKQIKLLTARELWHSEGLFEASNADDKTVQKAVEILK